MAKQIILSDGEWKLMKLFVGKGPDDTRRYGGGDAG